MSRSDAAHYTEKRRLDSTARAISAELQDLRAELLRNNHPAASCNIWEIVLAEALNNVVEHAYSDRAGHPIDVTLDFSHRDMQAEIRDQGAPMPARTLPKGLAPNLMGSVSDLPEGGFGWNLIRRLTDTLEYRRIGNANHLRFSVSLESG